MRNDKPKSSGSLCAAAVFFLLVFFVLSLCTGRYPLTLPLLFSGDDAAVRVFLTLRLPRACMAVLGGFALGVTGRIYQMLFHNPLASPDIIGVSSGASAGAAFAILFLPPLPFAVTLSAFFGGLLAVFFALGLSSLSREAGHAPIVLSGIAVHALAQTLLLFLKLTADPEKQLASIEYWIMGSLNGLTLAKLPAASLLCIVSLSGIFLLYRQALLLTVEDGEAQMLGVPVRRMRMLLLLLSTLASAAVISVTGLISFIGLLAPHTALRLCRHSRRSSLFFCGLCGSLLLCVSDILARSVSTSELPVSIFTSLLGAPFLLWFMQRRN